MTPVGYLIAALGLGWFVLGGGWWIYAEYAEVRVSYAQLQQKRAELARDAQVAAVDEWMTAYHHLGNDLSECRDKWQDAQNGAAEALAEAERGRVAAELLAQAWERRWNARTSSCGAALLEAERACPELDGY